MSTRRVHYGWIVLTVSTLVVFGAMGLARYGYTMLLPAMQQQLSLDNTAAGGLATANMVGYLVLAVLGGALASHFGPRRVIAAGLAVAGIGMFLTGLSTDFMTAALWRMVTGTGSAASNVPVMALLTAWFAPRRRGMAAGIAVAGSSMGLIVLGPLVPYVIALNETGGWRTCWFLLGGMTVVLAVLGLIFLRNRPSAMNLLPVGADPGAPMVSGPQNGGLHWGKVYRSLTVWHVGVVYTAYGFSYIIYMTFFVKALVTEGDYTPGAAGNLFMFMGWFSVLCGLIWGAISDAIGRKRALIIVYLIHTVAFSLFALYPHPWGFVISAMLFGISAWSIPAIMTAVCGDLLGSRLAPAGLGFITLFLGAGQAAGPYVGGRLADATHSLYPAFLLAGGVAFLGVISAALLPALSKNPADPNVAAQRPGNSINNVTLS